MLSNVVVIVFDVVGHIGDVTRLFWDESLHVSHLNTIVASLWNCEEQKNLKMFVIIYKNK